MLLFTSTADVVGRKVVYVHYGTSPTKKLVAVSASSHTASKRPRLNGSDGHGNEN